MTATTLTVQQTKIVTQVKELAKKYRNSDKFPGWDIIDETYDEKDIAQVLFFNEYYPPVVLFSAALEIFDNLASVFEDRRSDAKAMRDESL